MMRHKTNMRQLNVLKLELSDDGAEFVSVARYVRRNSQGETKLAEVTQFQADDSQQGLAGTNNKRCRTEDGHASSLHPR